MKIVLLQHVVSADLRRNLAQILMQLHLAKRGDWFVFPEGMLSGYFPADTDYITKLDRNRILEAIGIIPFDPFDHEDDAALTKWLFVAKKVR